MERKWILSWVVSANPHVLCVIWALDHKVANEEEDRSRHSGFKKVKPATNKFSCDVTSRILSSKFHKIQWLSVFGRCSSLIHFEKKKKKMKLLTSNFTIFLDLIFGGFFLFSPTMGLGKGKWHSDRSLLCFALAYSCGASYGLWYSIRHSPLHTTQIGQAAAAGCYMYCSWWKNDHGDLHMM